MKIILSRKGFDAEYGGQPSPILPDGTLLSMPIPYPDEVIKYTDLHQELLDGRPPHPDEPSPEWWHIPRCSGVPRVWTTS